MGKTVSTNFSLRLNNATGTKVVGDSKIATALVGENFYVTTLTVDTIGVYLGEISDFIAIQTKNPVLVEFQRVDMESKTQIYCSKLFINHGDLGKVWLRTLETPAIVTLWYSTDNTLIDKSLYVEIKKNSKTQKLSLRNLLENLFSIPIKDNAQFIGLNNEDDGIPVITHSAVNSKLTVYSE